MHLRPRLLLALVAATFSAASNAAAQAFTPPEAVGSVTVGWQLVDNTGHWLTDGFLRQAGQSVTTSVLVEIEYGITDRFAATAAIPYVFAKYTGALPPPSGLPVDQCACWHSAFQDVALAARYRFGSDTWAVTPVFRYDQPSHGYAYRGEAVVGRDLKEAQIGVAAGVRLTEFLPKTTVETGYTYAFVQKALGDISINRSNGFVTLGYPVKRWLYAHGSGVWQRTHGGLRAGSVTGVPFQFPGELNTPERQVQRDRLIRTNYWHLEGGVAYSAGPLDLFVSATKYIWGRDAHNGQAYTAGTTWYFDLGR